MYKLFFTIIILSAFVLPALPASADYTTDLQTQLQSAAGTKGANYGNARDPREVAALVVQVMLGTVGVLFTLYMVYAGFLITLSAGEEEKVEKGKKVIRYCVIGLLITFSAFSITLFVNKYLLKAQQYNKPTTPLYSGSEFTVDEDTSQYYNSDPLNETINEGTIW
ncbi:MAG: hypothetical protein A2921_00785 [Candidatus Magasanikbacteria bacterium RIFCSPLOWO2_01_FULL_43_20b]|uniref:DUF5671 domain-containing protein n=1 Tax=Candidatus Magasanikbacteria bacterium RIFCSPLOWO2_12_FULL_43_12 TaxID=1798692 RepID=A0A1F6MVH5_9BACT|nr:MAG: hypothetical protein A3I93_03295 [Candidatus Magasanikbacteria bacterium RIFCSPLOWO2_02_FULL_43_22]OGH72815.1 MAG: hypothetical protein A2921_00785 [Candidatus Magasanikbacteria bacterium RIFCSPLOWO2_01_FULL_43_20b]OGH75611.1 MAG: hypothetical protein A3G00_03900 [Candidatus Magasanikbacteria bacterium RIFCSPLOWO2_12_FULL_43_12]